MLREHLGRGVAESADVGDLPFEGVENPSYSKIDDLDLAMRFVSVLPPREYYILQLEIAVHYSLFMAVVDSLE